MKKLINVKPVTSDYEYCRWDVNGVNGSSIIDFTASYGGPSVQHELITGAVVNCSPKTVIVNDTVDLETVFIPGNVQTLVKIRATKNIREQIRRILDDHRADGIVIADWHKYIPDLRDIDNTVRIGKQIYLFEVSQNIQGQMSIAFLTRFVTGVISAMPVQYANYGVVMTNNNLQFDIPYPHFSLWSEDKSMSIVGNYNQMAMYCWLNGIQPKGFNEFLKGEL